MFNKPFKVKSNNHLKGTERKKLCEEVIHAFPSLKDEIQNLLRKKDIITMLKIVTHTGQINRVYCSAKTPLFFQLDNPVPRLYPTIFTLWHYPDLLSSFTTHSSVISILSNGADLMLPGVFVGEEHNLYSYGKLPKGAMVSVNTKDNKAPVAVGLTALSSECMYMSGGRGKCVEIIHVIGDTLCQLDNSVTRPQIDYPLEEPAQPKNENDNGSIKIEQISKENIDIEKLNIDDENNDDREFEINDDVNENIELPKENAVEKMDKLLEYCFLKACKIDVKASDLPILSSKFFKNYVLAACPSNENLDIKQSSYKKLSVFLNSMVAQGVIETFITKGVQSILSIKYNHELVKNLVIGVENTNKQSGIHAPVITDCYKVTTNVLPILSKFGCEKGDILKTADVRKFFQEYVKKEGLQNGSIFKVNGPLADVFHTNESVLEMKMVDGINKFIGKMTLMKEITTGDTTLLHTGNLGTIDITVSTRCASKKVTLVNNLEMFGIKLDTFRKECQEIGASAVVTDVPGKKTPSVLVQGNQVLYVYKLLTEKYRIKKNYIRGLEFAPKKSK